MTAMHYTWCMRRTLRSFRHDLANYGGEAVEQEMRQRAMRAIGMIANGHRCRTEHTSERVRQKLRRLRSESP